MENEKNVKVVLTDEELKEVAGGNMSQMEFHCSQIGSMNECTANPLCEWANGACVDKR
jgi:hypothetical protein